MKTCAKCHAEKNSVCFAADHRKADGLSIRCRECDRESREHSSRRLRDKAKNAAQHWSFAHIGYPGELSA